MDKNLEIMTSEMKKIQKGFVKSLSNYKKYIDKISLDAPIEILCLSKSTLKILKSNGFNRVSEISAYDLTKIKGIGDARRREINFRISQLT